MNNAWRQADTLVPEAGVEILIRLYSHGADPVWIGASVHQIARWNEEGDLFALGRKIRMEDILGWAPLPKFERETNDE